MGRLMRLDKRNTEFVFHRGEHTMWLAEDKHDALIDTLLLKKKNAHFGIPFLEFYSVIYKFRHSFLSIPIGKGLMSQFYCILGKGLQVMFLCCNAKLQTAIQEGCIFLHELVSAHMKCSSLVTSWPHTVGVTDPQSMV